VRYTERLADAEAVASVGTVGDSYDCETGLAAPEAA
jgi:putative transposase